MISHYDNVENARRQIDQLLALLGDIEVRWLTSFPNTMKELDRLRIQNFYARQAKPQQDFDKIMRIVTDTADEYKVTVVVYFGVEWNNADKHGFRLAANFYDDPTRPGTPKWIRRPQ